MTPRPVDLLIHYMPAIARETTDKWIREFAESICRQSRRRNWQPSPKQREIMQRLVGELFNEPAELEVIEK